MAFRTTVAGLMLIGALSTLPAFAEAGQRQRGGSDRQDRQGGRASGQAQPRSESRQGGESAAPQARNEGSQNGTVQRQQSQSQPQYQSQQSSPARQYQSQPQRQYQSQPQQRYQSQRQYAVPRQYSAPRYSYNDSRPYYSNRSYAYGSYGYRSYGYGRRVIYPTIVTVVPYRPYVYRPHFGLGVYYGAGGSYAYGVTPPVYYNPQPGGYYGGLRITGAPRDAQVFADGYYVGIVDDFDGVFQHVNLEAGRHHIEIQSPGYQAVEFDVDVQPGRTMTFRADVY